ncbi:carbohydrate ABC transporter permease [Oceanobacillus neutriphilus]|uniref:ABC transporter permease n=1 Tax=Oceanobacillus neutriphilus TaxID=531815 RepID=A0ABQ2P268_9BACI|nr:carbohydrate ABC transporter permease [Oceanobacillus neutriphilus]GGP16400.1 ABC transporter permease [Oceanobacillus neutriphilus]
MKLINLPKKICLYILVIGILLFTGYPFVYMIMTSFKSMKGFFLDPFSLFSGSLTLENYSTVFDMGIGSYFTNSLIITVLSVLLVVFISALASYPLSRIKFKLNRPLFLLFIAGMMVPMHATLIPIFLLTQNMGLYDSLTALLGPYIAFSLPISIFILTQFMGELPKELEEAAQLDGANHWNIFWKILFPNLAPAISTIVIYNFLYLWTEFIFALTLITDTGSMTLPLGLQDFYGEFTVNVPGLMAALVLASLPVIAVFIIAQERVVKGLTGGSVKG